MPRQNIGGIAAGAIVALLGLYFAWTATRYGIGTARAMRAGYFPRMVGVATLAMGLLMVAQALLTRETLGRIAWRPLIGVMAGIAVFAVLLRSTGLVPATIGSVMVSIWAHPGNDWKTGLALGVATAAATWLVFIVGLGMPVRAFAGVFAWI